MLKLAFYYAEISVEIIENFRRRPCLLMNAWRGLHDE